VEFHPSVLVKEVTDCLRPRPGGVYLDATCGTAGHSLALLEACQGARVVGIERDPSLAERARRRVLKEGIRPERFTLVEGAFSGLRTILGELMLFETKVLLVRAKSGAEKRTK
jgi:16S rRNA (cytosine1402-N4)-methyltransferase